MASDCAKEGVTQHFLGKGYGHGPVGSGEMVIFAVFQKTPREGNRPVATTFPVKQLNRGEISLARETYTTRMDFEARVVQLQK
jgi:hypothetical protein